jgi:hypothetical protein
MLHLASAQLSSREGRSSDADTHLTQAAELANATGECNDLNYHFGSANVAAWSVSIGVELECGPDAAERVTADVPRLVAVLGIGGPPFWTAPRPGPGMGAGRRRSGRRGDPLPGRGRSDRPARIRNDPIARDLVLTLDRRVRRRVWELDSLRNRFGVGGQGRPRSVNN